MTHQIVLPKLPSFYRLKNEDMCGPLPPALFKVLPERYARRLLDDGELMWSTLAWFQNVEDPSRADEFEGTRRHFPPEGLDVTRTERDGVADHEAFTLLQHGTQWRPLTSHHIFIYSLTLDSELALGDQAAQTCVEVFNPSELVRRIREALARDRSGRPETLIHDKVKYWSSDEPIGEVWAFPHMLAMRKSHIHSWQKEYRLAFGTRADVFDAERIEGRVLSSDVRPSRRDLDPQCHRKRLYVGSLIDCCRVRER